MASAKVLRKIQIVAGGPPAGDLPVIRREYLVAADAAQALLWQAQEQAEGIRSAAHEDGMRSARDAQAQSWEALAQVQRDLNAERERIGHTVSEQLAPVLAAALDGLAVDLPFHAQVQSSLARLAEQVPAQASASLHLHPSALAALEPGVVETLPWPAQPDAALAEGSCCLRTEHGSWHTSFETAISALRRQALLVSVAEGIAR